MATEVSIETNGRYYGAINIWNSITGRKKCVIEDTTHNFFYSAQFSPDGKSILANESILLINDRGMMTNTQSVARFWDAKTGGRIRDFGQDGLPRFPVGLPLFTPDGNNIICGGTNSTITLRDAKSGKEIRRFEIPGSEGWWYVEKIFLSKDGERLVAQYLVSSGQMAVALWNVDTGELIKEFDKGPALAGETVIGFSPKGENFLLFDQKLKPELFDGATGKRLKVLEQYQSP
jgi:WD40 repeat protein